MPCVFTSPSWSFSRTSAATGQTGRRGRFAASRAFPLWSRVNAFARDHRGTRRPMSSFAPFVSSSLRGEKCSRKNNILKVRGPICLHPRGSGEFSLYPRYQHIVQDDGDGIQGPVSSMSGTMPPSKRDCSLQTSERTAKRRRFSWRHYGDATKMDVPRP